MLTINLHPFPTLSTERLTLRQVTVDDKNDLFALRSSAEVMKYIDRPLAKSVDEMEVFIQKIKELEVNNNGIHWGIALNPDSKLIGVISFWRIDKENHRAEMGYLLRAEFHGKGIMQEAFNAVIPYGFNVLNFHSIEANVNPNNSPSIKILERNKFVREGYFKEDYYYNGKFLDSAIYSLLKSNLEK